MASNIRVLLVDDNPMIIALLRQAISTFATVETFTNSADALVRMLDSAPDLLISDYSMPGLDGKQLIEKIRGRAQTAKLPAILIATHTEVTEQLRSMHDRVEDLIEKPFFVKEIASRIKRVIDKISLEKMARALEVPLYQLFYEGEEPPRLPNLLKRKSSSDIAWGSSGKDARFLSKLRRVLSKTDEEHRKLVLHMAQKMVRR